MAFDSGDDRIVRPDMGARTLTEKGGATMGTIMHRGRRCLRG